MHLLYRPVFIALFSVLVLHCGDTAAFALTKAPSLQRQPHGRAAMQKRGDGGGPRLRMSATSSKAINPDDASLELVDDKPRATEIRQVSQAGFWKRSELFVRSVQVFWTAGRLFLDYKILQWRTNQMTEEQEERSEELWEAAHLRNADFLYSQFVSLEGLWVKLGQFLSSRADVMPGKYVEVLSKCQDSLPSRPFSQARHREIDSYHHTFQQPHVFVWNSVVFNFLKSVLSFSQLISERVSKPNLNSQNEQTFFL